MKGKKKKALSLLFQFTYSHLLMKEQLYCSGILKYFQHQNRADSQPPSSLSEVFMRSARQRSFQPSPYLPSKEGRGVNIAAFSTACLDYSFALSWVFCYCAWKSRLCPHWALGLSNETAKDDSNYFLLSPVFRPRAKPTRLSRGRGGGELLWGQSSWLCSPKCSPRTCRGARCFCRARTWKFFPFSTLCLPGTSVLEGQGI